jgi:hypothetical protein
LQTLQDDYSASGLTVITVMYEDNTHAPADVAFAATWASTYGLTHPVWADPLYTAHGLYFQSSQPSYVIFDRDMVIQFTGSGTSISTLESEINKHL